LKNKTVRGKSSRKNRYGFPECAEQIVGPERRGREVIADFQLPIVDLIRAARSTQTFGGAQHISDDPQSAPELMTQRNSIMTTRTRILASAATALVVGYVLGYYFGGGVHTSQHQVLTSRELTCLSTYAATLQLLDENQPTKASRLLEDRLRASVTALRDLTTRPVQVESPEFVQGLRQAEAYARRHDLNPTLGEIKEVAQHLGIQL
jgi:hypothetical protein